MSATTNHESPLTHLEAACRRGADVDELLGLADNAIDGAVAAEDRPTLEQVAGELERTAAARRADGRGLRIAAARARAALSTLPAAHAAPQPQPPPVPAALELAHMDRRVAAFVLDWILLWTILIWVADRTSEGTYVFVWLALPPAYFAVLHWAYGRTPGKFAVGTAVRRADGERIGLGAALGRTAIQALLAISIVGFFVDSLKPLRNPRKQTLHDEAAGTIVIRVRRSAIT